MNTKIFLMVMYLAPYMQLNAMQQQDNQPAKPCHKFVLTGGPGVGKSTIINLLQENGHQTRPEVWTSLYQEAKSNNTLAEFSTESSSPAFRQKIIGLQLSHEGSLEKNSCAFLDRSAVDHVAFGNLYNIPMSESITDLPKTHRYDLVFLLEPLPAELYDKPKELNCSQETSIMIHQHLKKSYQEYGYSLINVPFSSPETRMAFILKTVITWLERNKSL